MKLETAKRIVDIAEENGIELKLYENYSGRGMFGRTTTGIVGSQTAIIEAVGLAAWRLGNEAGAANEQFEAVEEGHDEETELKAERDVLQDASHAFLDDLKWSWDSMGRSDSIAY